MAKTFTYHLLITGENFQKVLDLPVGITTVGREPGNLLQLSDTKISRRHARFEVTDIECTLTDLGSANGTLVNGVQIPANVPTVLHDQDVVVIGTFKLLVTQREGSEAVAFESVGEISEFATRILPEKEPQPAEPEKMVEKPVVRKKKEVEAAAPPEPPHPPPVAVIMEMLPGSDIPLFPGLSTQSRRLLEYLPGIYHTDFMSHFLAMFESILMPVESNIDNFDLFLNPGTAPADFLPWLSNWFEIVFDSTWNETQQRQLLKEASLIFARRGTAWSLSRVLEIYTGSKPEIVEFFDPKDVFMFKVSMPVKKEKVNQDLVARIINSNKPAHTSYVLEFK